MTIPEKNIQMPSLGLLCGGLGKRLGSLTKQIPKALVEINGEPFIAHQLRLVSRSGVKNVVVCAGYLGEQIKTYVGSGERFNVNVSYSFDGEKLLGTGGAVKKALPLLSDPFLIMYGDSYLNADFAPIIKYFYQKGAKALVTVFRNKNQWGTSNIAWKNGVITEYSKRSSSLQMEYIDYGLTMIRKSSFDSFSDIEAFDLDQVFIQMVHQDEMLGFEVEERFYEIGSLAGLEKVKQ